MSYQSIVKTPPGAVTDIVAVATSGVHAIVLLAPVASFGVAFTVYVTMAASTHNVTSSSTLAKIAVASVTK